MSRTVPKVADITNPVQLAGMLLHLMSQLKINTPIMGIDNANLFNHTIKYNNGEELVAQLKERLELPVYNEIFNDVDDRVSERPPGFNGLVISTGDSRNLDDYIKTGQLLTFDRICPGDNGHFDINRYVIENSLPEAYLERWWDTAQMCKLIRLYGLMSFEEYEAVNSTRQVNVMHGPYVLQKRKRMQPHIQKFGSTAMLTFCSDYHNDYIDHIADNWTFDDFISWGKKEFIFIDFKDLPLFDFPDNKPDSHNVFIYDDFPDLKKRTFNINQ